MNESRERKITDESIKHLKEIINYFNNGQISAFIGAGFSKNASTEYPDWNQLLSGMVKELFQEELKGLDKEAEQHTIGRIINREGTLKIPEQYVNYKGRRETLTTYIEKYFRPIDDKITKDQLEIHRKLLMLPWNDILTTNYDLVLEVANDSIGKRWEKVSSASGLSQFPRGRIVKLHGDLRKNNDEPFGFDGSSEHNYIITQSDYDTYPQSHYGFTTFMQSKILQESFCMIGFSGNDPNFKYWVYWVRDLLKKSNNKYSPIPIYLIDVTPKEEITITPDLELFYKNHNIQWVPLCYLYDHLWQENHKRNFPKRKNQII